MCECECMDRGVKVNTCWSHVVMHIVHYTVQVLHATIDNMYMTCIHYNKKIWV